MDIWLSIKNMNLVTENRAHIVFHAINLRGPDRRVWKSPLSMEIHILSARLDIHASGCRRYAEDKDAT
jgi:hypothetical protein